MFRSKTSATPLRLEDLEAAPRTTEAVDVPTAELAVVAGGRWRPSWTSPRDPDDIFRDDG